MTAQRDLHQQLGLRPRDQRALVDQQVERAEGLTAEDVRERLSPGAAVDQGIVGGLRGGVEREEGPSEEPGTVDAEGVLEEDPGLARRVLDAGESEALGGPGERLAGGHAGAPASRSSRSCVWSASITAPRSPSRIRSRPWTVRLIRWSVRRSCGKL